MGISYLIVEDHNLFAQALDQLLQVNGKYDSLGVLNPSKQLITEITAAQPDILFLDLNMPEISGFDVLLELKNKNSKIKTIIVSMLVDPFMIEKALSMGAQGYIPKNTDFSELEKAIETVMKHQIYLNDNIKSQLQSQSSNAIDNGLDYMHTYNKLSKREKEILKQIAQGLTNKQIAENLFLSPLTVKTHRHNILHKLNLQNTASVVRFVSSLGII